MLAPSLFQLGLCLFTLLHVLFFSLFYNCHSPNSEFNLILVFRLPSSSSSSSSSSSFSEAQHCNSLIVWLCEASLSPSPHSFLLRLHTRLSKTQLFSPSQRVFTISCSFCLCFDCLRAPSFSVTLSMKFYAV